MPASHLILAAALAVGLWGHPGYDAEDSHFNPRETTITAETITKVTRKWQVKLRTDAESCSRFAHPVVTASRIHTSDQLGISTYNTKTGEPLWRYDWADKSDYGTPRLAVSDGLVLVAGSDCNSQSDPDGYLIALDARTGRPRWRQSLEIPVRSMVVDKQVIVVSGGSPSDGDRVLAVSAPEGRPLWSRENALTSEVSANGRLLIRTTDGSGAAGGTSAAVAATDGRDLWTRKGTWTAQTADPRSEWFYATAESGALQAIRTSDGSARWTIPDFATTLLATDGNHLYRVSDKDVLALNTADGTKAWSTAQSGAETQPSQAGGLLYAGAEVLNPDNGTVTGPAFPGTVLITDNQIHQLNQGVLTTWAP